MAQEGGDRYEVFPGHKSESRNNCAPAEHEQTFIKTRPNVIYIWVVYEEIRGRN
jgi:hypothetical protein